MAQEEMYLKCVDNKEQPIPKNCGEQLSSGETVHHNSRGDCYSEHDSTTTNKRENIIDCRCKSCRTKMLTCGRITLKCHYCSTGFLVCIDDERSSFVCIDCNKLFDRLPFTIRLCDELEDDVRFWCDDYDNRNDPERALYNWDQMYRQLTSMACPYSLKMIRLTLQLAKAMAICPQFTNNRRRAVQLIQMAIKSLLDYEMGSVANKVELNEIIQFIEHVHELIESEHDDHDDPQFMLEYLTAKQELKTLKRLYANVQLDS